MVPTICRFLVMSSTTRTRILADAAVGVGAGFIAPVQEAEPAFDKSRQIAARFAATDRGRTPGLAARWPRPGHATPASAPRPLLPSGARKTPRFRRWPSSGKVAARPPFVRGAVWPPVRSVWRVFPVAPDQAQPVEQPESPQRAFARAIAQVSGTAAIRRSGRPD